MKRFARRFFALAVLALAGSVSLSVYGAVSGGGVSAGNGSTPIQVLGGFGSGYSMNGAAGVRAGPVARLVPLLQPPIPGDSDGDSAIDLTDAADLFECLSGPDVILGPTGSEGNCRRVFDFDGDFTVTLYDVAEFSLVFGTGN